MVLIFTPLTSSTTLDGGIVLLIPQQPAQGHQARKCADVGSLTPEPLIFPLLWFCLQSLLPTFGTRDETKSLPGDLSLFWSTTIENPGPNVVLQPMTESSNNILSIIQDLTLTPDPVDFLLWHSKSPAGIVPHLLVLNSISAPLLCLGYCQD